jgi:hypothetical protein
LKAGDSMQTSLPKHNKLQTLVGFLIKEFYKHDFKQSLEALITQA